MPIRCLRAAALTALVALGVVGCGTQHKAQPPGSSASPATPVNSSADPVTAALAQRAGAGPTAFTSTYDAVAVGGRKAVVRVYVRGASYRVEVVENGQTAALYGSRKGTTACPLKAGHKPVCFAVARAGAPVPAQFDAGVERVFTQDLPTLAAHADRFTVAEKPAVGTARCFAVSNPTQGATGSPASTPTVDAGTYCLDPAGRPVRLTFTSGTLTLHSSGPAPTAAQLVPPASPRPLPSRQ